MNSEDMNDLIGGIVALAFLAVCLVTVVVLYLRSRHRTLSLSASDQAGMQDLLGTARRMETRIGYLETVLDTEVPGWRSRSGTR